MNIYERELTRVTEYLRYIETSGSWRVTKIFRIIFDKINFIKHKNEQIIIIKSDENNILFEIFLIEKKSEKN